MNIIKLSLKKLFNLFYPKEIVKKYSLKPLFHGLIFQKILRINSSAKWLVHYTSVVLHPEKIVLKSLIVSPGFAPNAYIQANNGIIFGKNIIMAPGVKIVSANHDIYDYTVHPNSNPIILGDNCWLGANCVILPGVELGNHTIVAAGAVVNKSFLEGNIIIGGVPAKILKHIDNYSGKIW